MTDTLTLNGQTLRIPVLATGATSLMKQLSDDHIPFEQLAAVIEQFPSISMRLISLANSAWSGSSVEVTSVIDACTRLGFNVVRSTSIALVVSAPFDPHRCPAFQPVRYWRDSMLVAEAAFGLTPDDRRPSPLCSQTMRTLGLLHNLGLLWLADSMPRETQDALLMSEADETLTVSAALIKTCGFDYCTVAEALCNAWQLPDAMTRVLAHMNNAEYRQQYWQGAELLRISKQLINTLGSATPESLAQIETDRLDIEFSAVRAEYRRLEQLQPRINDLASSLFLN